MKKILSAVLSAVMACTMLSMPVQAAKPTNLSDIGKEIEVCAEDNEDSCVSFAAAVYSGDEVLYSEHFGYIDRENAILADENTVYEWGSIFKMCIWVSMIQLYEQGKIDLDADIRTYLPDGFLTKLQYDEPITMLHLMAYVQDDAIEGEFTAVMIFAIISVINLIILIAELIILLVKKQKLELENYIILAGQLAKLVLAAALIILLFCTISPAVCTALSVTMGLCAVICLISGVLNGIIMFSKQERKLSRYVWRSIFSLCCLFVCGFAIYFELFNFWT